VLGEAPPQEEFFREYRAFGAEEEPWREEVFAQVFFFLKGPVGRELTAVVIPRASTCCFFFLERLRVLFFYSTGGGRIVYGCIYTFWVQF
jgi:hypothetical protein